MNKVVYIGIIGYGVVGKGTVAALIDNFKTIKGKTGIDIVIKGIADRSIDKKEDNYLSNVEIKTNNYMDLINDKR